MTKKKTQQQRKNIADLTQYQLIKFIYDPINIFIENTTKAAIANGIKIPYDSFCSQIEEGIESAVKKLCQKHEQPQNKLPCVKFIEVFDPRAEKSVANLLVRTDRVDAIRDRHIVEKCNCSKCNCEDNRHTYTDLHVNVAGSWFFVRRFDANPHKDAFDLWLEVLAE